MAQDPVAKKLEVNGIVQGVGFRPFVYQLARRFDLSGEVANTSSGVTILLEGPPASIDAFAENLAENPPPLAHIIDIRVLDVPVNGHKDFTIVKSRGGAAMATLISPDVAVCNDCRREMFDPRDRRYHYPFINCTNCGPRYTIIEDIPYDRPKTSMKHFRMCDRCQAEYDDPMNRRFHAQPNACAVCGPHVRLLDNRRHPVEDADPIRRTAELLKQGGIVAVKGLGGFHLAVDATHATAVRELRRRKHREEKPLALMAEDVDRIAAFARMGAEERKRLQSIQRPIVLLEKKHPNPIADSVSPRNRYFGVMLPYTPLHYLLMAHGFTALVMTSANLSEEPIACDNADAFQRLGGIADYFLVHNRDIYLRSDDSIVRRSAGATRLIRRSRGYVPIPVFLKEALPPVLAVGAELKNTVCLTKGNQAFLSQHIGDLENLSTYEFFQLTIDHMQRILETRPDVIAVDLHPDYLSTKWALEQPGVETIAVQHHHAHIVSVMAENRIDGPVIGLSFDGTGYGTDGTIWGGEVLVAEAHDFSRAAHLEPVPMPGSAAAIKQPWRMALSYLYSVYAEDFRNLKLPVLEAWESQKIRIVIDMIAKGINAPQTSSLGRLFDGVAAIIGLRDEVAFEGQAAMELEMTAADDADRIYDTARDGGIPGKISLAPIIRGVVDDVVAGVAPALISARFHQTLVSLFGDVCEGLRRENGLNRVALSGGAFQNDILLRGITRTLVQKGFEVYSHRQVPTNDGGISLGQAAAAAARLKK